MDEHYRLVFRGEVLDGQHAAVVKKRLIGLLKIDAERGEKLFTGRPIVLVKNADTKTAARYQKAFREIGARLRVLPVDTEVVADAEPTTEPAGSTATNSTEALERASSPVPLSTSGPGASRPPTEATAVDREVVAAAADSAAAAVGSAAQDTVEFTTQMGAAASATDNAAGATDEFPVPDFGVAPVGSDLAPSSERESAAETAPDTSHLTLAAPGTRLSDSAPVFETMEIPDVHFDLLEAGVALGVERAEAEPELEIDVDWNLAEVGADLAPSRPPQSPPPAPSTEHLELLEEELEGA